MAVNLDQIRVDLVSLLDSINDKLEEEAQSLRELLQDARYQYSHKQMPGEEYDKQKEALEKKIKAVVEQQTTIKEGVVKYRYEQENKTDAEKIEGFKQLNKTVQSLLKTNTKLQDHKIIKMAKNTDSNINTIKSSKPSKTSIWPSWSSLVSAFKKMQSKKNKASDEKPILNTFSDEKTKIEPLVVDVDVENEKTKLSDLLTVLMDNRREERGVIRLQNVSKIEETNKDIEKSKNTDHAYTDIDNEVQIVGKLQEKVSSIQTEPELKTLREEVKKFVDSNEQLQHVEKIRDKANKVGINLKTEPKVEPE